MFTRMLKCTLKPEQKEEFQEAARKLSAAYKGQAGFVDLLTFISDEHPDQALVVAVWKSRGDSDTFYLHHAPLLDLTPFVARYEVEHFYFEGSTAYPSASGKAA